jgi:hypothetical protein
MMKPSNSPRPEWRRLASLLLLIVTGSTLRAAEPAKPTDPSEVIWRSQRMCGVNCLYTLLRAYGFQDVSYKDLTDEVLTGRSDTSLTDIKRAAARRGLRCAIGRTDEGGLTAAPKPVVAHCEQVDPTGTLTGHFVLVIETDREGVKYLDGTTAQLGQYPWHEFKRRWTGYIVYADAGWPAWAVIAASVPLGVALGVLVDRFAFGRRTRRTPAGQSPALIPEGSLP